VRKKGEEKNERSVLFLNERDPLSPITQGSCHTTSVLHPMRSDKVREKEGVTRCSPRSRFLKISRLISSTALLVCLFLSVSQMERIKCTVRVLYARFRAWTRDDRFVAVFETSQLSVRLLSSSALIQLRDLNNQILNYSVRLPQSNVSPENPRFNQFTGIDRRDL